MIKLKFYNILGLVSLIGTMTLTSCDSNNNNVVSNADGSTTTTISVAFAECGYGSEFLSKWEEAYNAANPMEKIKLDLDGDAQMTQNILTRLQTGSNLPDLIMVLSTNWQKWAASGYLLEIDDVYEATDSNNNDMKMKDFIDPNLSKFGIVNDHYYSVPWSVGTTGFVYNKTMFQEWGWKVPTTVKELEELCEQIKSDTNGTVQPFSWSTGTSEYWSFVTLNWWAQYEGADNFKEFWKFESADVFKQQGRVEALKEFEKLVCGKDGNGKATGEAINSITDSKFMVSQMNFINGKAAMMPNGAWIENEMKGSIPEGFEMALMPTPAINGAKTDDNGEVISVNVNSSGDFICIPKKAKNTEMAKKFLKFINTKEGCEIFTRYSGGIRPFNYKPSEVEGLSDFTLDIARQWEKSINLYQTSTSYMYFNNDLNLWPGYGSPYARMVQDGETAEEVCNTIYSYVASNWSKFTKKEL